MKLSLMVALVCVSFCTASSVEAAIFTADSVADFSDTQGQNGWFYGLYDGDAGVAYTPDDFEEFPFYSSSNQRWSFSQTFGRAGNYWTLMNLTGAHPNGTSPAHEQRAIHYAVRRFVLPSEVGGPAAYSLSVNGDLVDGDTTNSAGNGFNASILVDGTVIYFSDLPDGFDTTYSIDFVAQPGSTIDFVVDPKSGDDAEDSTTFTAMISGVGIAVPEPASALLLASFGLLALGGRRRRTIG